MITKMWIEGDGETDQYGLRIQKDNTDFVIQGFSRKEMNYLLKDLVDQFLSLSSCFDEMKEE